MRQLPLHNVHQEFNPKWAEFAGFNMPMQYVSQIEEHMQVRQFAGVFDISHMGVIDVNGDSAKNLLSFLLANNIDLLNIEGQAQYGVMLNEDGGIIDDLICYYMAPSNYRLIVNASRIDKVLSWVEQINQQYLANISCLKNIAVIAVQGPAAINIVTVVLQKLFEIKLPSLKKFHAVEINNWFIARTGYTGEDGLEIIAFPENVAKLFASLVGYNIAPCGLGARDSLRLEAGLNLYGLDMTEENNPYESNLGWTVKINDTRDFMGKAALQTIKEKGVAYKLTGVVLDAKGMLRANQKIITNKGEGVVTSASYSPILKQSIGFVRVPKDAGEEVTVNIRQKSYPAHLVKPPFIENKTYKEE